MAGCWGQELELDYSLEPAQLVLDLWESVLAQQHLGGLGLGC